MIIAFYIFLIYDNFRGSVLIFNFTALPLIEGNRELLVEKIGKVNFYNFFKKKSFIFQLESYVNGSFSIFRDKILEEFKKTFFPSKLTNQELIFTLIL